MSRSVERLAERLTRDCQSDLERVTAIHHWITHHIAYDHKKFLANDLSAVATKTILKKRKAICQGYSNLFFELCRASAIPCARIDGVAKSSCFDVGRKSALTDHAWNAVQIDGLWYLVDCTWDSGYVKPARRTLWGCVLFVFSWGRKSAYRAKSTFVFAPSTRYFLQPGDVFIYDHYPALPDWKLQVDPTSYETFIADSAFYFQRIPVRSEQAGFNCATCEPIASMDSLDYMLAKGETEWANDSMNPRLLALKKTYIAELAYQPSASLEQKESNRLQFLEADSLNRLVLELWKEDKAMAKAYNDLKREEHKKYHAVVWKAQAQSIRALDEMRTTMQVATRVTKKRAVTWSKRHGQWQRQLHSIKFRRASSKPDNWKRIDAVLTQTLHQWDSISTELELYNARFLQLSDTLYQQVLAIEPSSVFRNIIFAMYTARRMGYDDLDWPIDRGDSAMVNKCSLRLEQIRGMQNTTTSSILRQLLRDQRNLFNGLQKLARQQKVVLLQWSDSLGNLERRDELQMLIGSRYAASDERLKLYHLQASQQTEPIAHARPELERQLRRERMIHQRDHSLELQLYAQRAKEINARHQAVYSIIKVPQRLTARRIRRLNNDIARLKAMNARS